MCNRTAICARKFVAVLVERLEARRLLSATPWGTQAVLIHQDQAVADYPWITGAGQTIAILDTGADYNMPVLGGGFGSGYKIEAGYNYINNTGNPMDDDGHGTGVTGLAAGDSFTYTDSATGLTAQFMGVAPGVNVVVVAYDNGGFGTATQDLLQDALNWVVANRTTYNIVAVNISNGFGNYSAPYVSPIFGADLETLADDGVFIAAASGNSGTQYPNEVESPGADPYVYAVGSVDLDGDISSFTQAGPMLALLAPGDGVSLPYLDNVTLAPVFVDTGDGTSFATPQVTGAAALLKQIDPGFTPAQIAQILEETGTPVFDAATDASYPLLNLDAAITQAYVTAGEPYGENNSIALATPLSFDSNGVAAQSDLALLVHNDNYYSFTLSSPTVVQFELGTTGATPPPFTLYDAGGTSLSNLGTNSTLTLQAGTYYIEVAANASASMAGTYNFSVTQVGPASSTGNNSLATALPITLDNGQGSIADQSLLNGQDDFYSFTLPSASTQTTLNLDYNGSDTAPTATLLNSSGQTIAPFNGSSLVQPLAAGSYYIDVSAAGTLAGTFTLSVDATLPPVSTPPAVGANGVVSSAAYDSNGTLYLAWFDTATSTLEFAQRSSSGTWSTPQQVDPEAGVGQNLSLAIDPAGQPAIAYYDAEDAELRYAYYNGNFWVIQTADTHGGADPSLAYNANGMPAISYYNNKHADLLLAVLKHSSWEITTVDSTKSVGQDSSLALDPATGEFGIAYLDGGNGSYKYAAQTSRGWSVQTVDNTTPGGGGAISLAFNHSNLPAFSYFDAFNAHLKFAQMNSKGKWAVATVVTRGSQGQYTSLSFTRRGAADILYYDKRSNAVFAAVGSIGSFTESEMDDDGGLYLSVAYNPLGGDTLVFYNPSDSGLDVEDI